MTIEATRDRILLALTKRKLLRRVGERPDGTRDALTTGAIAKIERDVHAEIDTILAGLVPPAKRRPR